MPALPASLLPFLPPGLSPSSSFVVLPMLPWFFALLALLGFVARHTLASLSFSSLRTLPDAVWRGLRALRRPTHAYSATSVLPITSPDAGRSTAPASAPQGTLRGRGRAHSKAPSGRSRFGLGLGLGLGRRAKSLGPVLPRFSPPSQAPSHHVRGTSTQHPHGTSAPASPGLQVPGFMRGDDDAVPLVDLSGSWASISSLSDRSVEASGSRRPSISEMPHPEPAVQLVDISHPDDEFELVDVSVPPSPAAWALAHPAPAHPPLHPTPAATAPTSPAAPVFPISSFSLAKPPASISASSARSTPVPAPIPPSSSSSALISATVYADAGPNIKSMNTSPAPRRERELEPEIEHHEQEVEVELTPFDAKRPDTPRQLPSPPLSPPHGRATFQVPAFASAGPLAWHHDNAVGVDGEEEGARDEEDAPLTARPDQGTVAMWEEEEEDAAEESEQQHLEEHAVVDASLPSLPEAELAQVEEPTPVEEEAQELELELPSASAIDTLVQRMHDQPPAPAPAYTDLPLPPPFLAPHEPLESEPTITDGAEVRDEEQAVLEELPSARAIDVLVGGMHALAAAAPAPVPAYVRAPVQEAEVPPYSSAPVSMAGRARLFADSVGADVVGSEYAEEEREDAEEEQEEEDGDGEGSEHAWDGEVVPLDEVLERVEGEPWAEQGDEDPDELPLPALPLPLPSRDSSRAVSPFGGQDLYEADAEEEREEQEEEDPAELPLPSMPLPLNRDADLRDAWAWAWDAPPPPPPPPADDGDVEPLVLDDAGAEGEGETEEGVEASEGRREEEEDEDEEDDGYEAEDGDADAVGVEAESDPESVDEEGGEDAPALRIDTAHLAPSPPHRPMSVAGALHVDTAHLHPAAGDARGDEDEDDNVNVREQDLASTLSSLSSTSPSSAAVTEGVRVVLPSASATLLPSASAASAPLLPRPSSTAPAEDADAETAALLPEKADADDDESDSSSSDDEVDLADLKPAWSRRAAAAPALGLPSSTREREREHAVPGAFPSSTAATFAASGTLTPASASASSASGEKETKTETGTSTAVEKKPANMRARYRSPLDAALAMQLRPGLGVGADGAWLVRFLMSFFGWFAVLVARTSDD